MNLMDDYDKVAYCVENYVRIVNDLDNSVNRVCFATDAIVYEAD